MNNGCRLKDNLKPFKMI